MNSRDAILRLIGVEVKGPGWVEGKTSSQIYELTKNTLAHNTTNDAGGWTKFGISQRAYPHLDIKNLTIDAAISLYKTDYWDKVKGDNIQAYALAFAIFDQAVNRGVVTAVKQAQKILGISQDGVAGNQFLSAINAANPMSFLNSFLSASEAAYRAIAAAKSSQNDFLNGWLNRVGSIRNYASENMGVVAGGGAVILILCLVAFFLISSSGKKSRLV